MKQLKKTKCSSSKKQKSVQEQLTESIMESYFQILNEDKEGEKKEDSSSKGEEAGAEEGKESEEDKKAREEAMKAAGISDSDVDKAASGMDEKQKSKLMKVLGFLGKMVNSASDSLLASNLEDFTLGNFREAVCDIYKSEKLAKMSEDDLKKEAEALHSSPGYEKAD